MKIAVIGATRGIGLAVVKASLHAGYKVTILVKNPKDVTLSHINLNVIQGDATEYDSVAKVVEGQDVICDCLGTTKVTQKITLFSRSAENLRRSMRSDQLLIAVTGIGSGDSKGHGGFLYDKLFMPLVLKRMYADKDVQENTIRTGISKWIIVRPGFLTNGNLTGSYRALTNLDGVSGGKISREDVADFIVSQIRSPEFIGKSPLLIY